MIRGKHVRVLQHVHRTRRHVSVHVDERHVEAGTVRRARLGSRRNDDCRLRIVRLWTAQQLAGAAALLAASPAPVVVAGAGVAVPAVRSIRARAERKGAAERNESKWKASTWKPNCIANCDLRIGGLIGSAGHGIRYDRLTTHVIDALPDSSELLSSGIGRLGVLSVHPERRPAGARRGPVHLAVAAGPDRLVEGAHLQ